MQFMSVKKKEKKKKTPFPRLPWSCLLTETHYSLILEECMLQRSLWVQPSSHCTIDSAALQFREPLAGYEK